MKRKVLIITDVLSIGGVERVIVDTLRGLDYSKFDVTLFVMYKVNGEEVNLNKLPEEITVQYLFVRSVKGIFQRILYYVIRFSPHSIISRLFVRGSYDIIITTKDIFAYPISASKCRKIMWIHSGLEHLETEKSTLINKLKRSMQKRVYNKFDRAILVSNSSMERFCNRYNVKGKGIVLQNPIDINEIARLSGEEIMDYKFKSGINIVSVCRLSSEKGVHRLINACKRLLNEGYNFYTIILGDGPERYRLEKAIAESHVLSEKVSILGFKENPYCYMNKCDIYVSSSLSEGFGLSIAEAIIMGLPIVSTYCNGPSEILDNGKYGLIVENSEDGIYEGLKKMLTTPELVEYFRVKSMERKEDFSYEKSIRLFEEIISENKSI